MCLQAESEVFGPGFCLTLLGGIVESIRGMPLAQQPDLWSKLQVQKDDEVSWRSVFYVTIGECFVGQPPPSRRRNHLCLSWALLRSFTPAVGVGEHLRAQGQGLVDLARAEVMS